ncbi:hypothetical protein [Methylobacterium indicum]|uniref:Lipoprotein n=1 Tax=Methylobacterium indicum TaxID=1775910 RepID=A0ABR5GVW3_9HYPH|nr:hypothetical protein [Methylobacterium indicum]KMO13990.1 hypothetical protein QR79_26370 [Methylobacterium indicum]KMO24599.1 hypothetical protein QR78_00040 [Methylobacterium indicum]
MIKPLLSATLCAACLMSATPVFAAENTIPQGKRDEMSQKYTEHQIKQQNKENREANRNVDSLITNRK